MLTTFCSIITLVNNLHILFYLYLYKAVIKRMINFLNELHSYKANKSFHARPNYISSNLLRMPYYIKSETLVSCCLWKYKLSVYKVYPYSNITNDLHFCL